MHRRHGSVSAGLVVVMVACADGTGSDTEPPSVSVALSPCCLVTIPGSQVSLTATASDNIGVEHVAFFVRAPGESTAVKFADDSVAPYTASYPPSGFMTGDDGSYELSAKAYDAAGNAGTRSIQLTVTLDRTPPTVTLATPGGRITSAVALPVTVSASEPLSRVELYEGTTRVASAIDPTLPKVLYAPLSAAQNGVRILTARAWDRAGNGADSPPDTALVDIRWEWDVTPVASALFEALTTTGSSVYAAGHTTNGFADAVLTKLDSSGAVVWTRTFGTGGIWDEAQSVARDVNGDVYLGAWRYDGAANLRDCLLVKYDATGAQLWTRVIDSGDAEDHCLVATDSVGAIYLAGMTLGTFDSSASDGSPKLFLTKYGALGNRLWIRLVTPLFSSSPGGFAGIAVDRAGSVYLTGMGRDSLNPVTGISPFVMKVDDAGNELWKRFMSSVTRQPAGLAVDGTSGVCIVGWGDAPGMFVVKYDSSGALLWSRLFGTPDSDEPAAVTGDSNGIYVTGSTYGAFPGLLQDLPDDVFLARFDANGVITDLRIYGAQGPEEGFAAAADGGGAVYVGGWLRGYQQGLVLKYHP